MNEQKFAIIAGDPETFLRQFNALKAKHVIVEKHISSNVMRIRNPIFGTHLGAPEFVEQLVVSAVIWHESKEISTEDNLKLIQ